MKNQRGFVPIIIILLALIGLGAFYFLGTLKSKPVSVVSPVPTVVSVASVKPITAPDPAANWKTYLVSNLNLK